MFNNSIQKFKNVNFSFRVNITNQNNVLKNTHEASMVLEVIRDISIDFTTIWTLVCIIGISAICIIVNISEITDHK